MGCLWERRYGTNRTNRHGKSEYPYLPDKEPKTEQEEPSSHPVTVTLETVPKPDRKTGKERKNNQKDNKNAQKRAQKTSSEANP